MIFRTSHEIQYLRGLFYSNRPVFLKAAQLILSDRRSYTGENMRVSVKKVKAFLLEMMECHHLENNSRAGALQRAPIAFKEFQP